MDDVKAAEEPLTSLRELVEKLEANLTQLQSEISSELASTRTGTGGSDEVSIFDYYLSGYTTKCGPQQVTGWTKNVDARYVAGTNNAFVAPVAGFYSICGWLRFKQGGNSVDITMRVNNNRKAAFGDAIQTDWRSTGTCFNYELAANDQVTMYLESGGSSDCIEETGWRYED